jgi:hypothetical protein
LPLSYIPIPSLPWFILFLCLFYFRVFTAVLSFYLYVCIKIFVLVVYKIIFFPWWIHFILLLISVSISWLIYVALFLFYNNKCIFDINFLRKSDWHEVVEIKHCTLYSVFPSGNIL